MISIRCPHCKIGLKVDETKLPPDIKSFACPKCKKAIDVSILKKNNEKEDIQTVILPSSNALSHCGKLHIIPNKFTSEQTIILQEGANIIGRKSQSINVPTSIITEDMQMSRAHILIEIKKDLNNLYNHYLSDNKSKNRTLYNNNYLETGEVVILKNKDEIQIGQTLLVFEI